MTKEWQEASNERAKEMKLNPISGALSRVSVVVVSLPLAYATVVDRYDLGRVQGHRLCSEQIDKRGYQPFFYSSFFLSSILFASWNQNIRFLYPLFSFSLFQRFSSNLKTTTGQCATWEMSAHAGRNVCSTIGWPGEISHRGPRSDAVWTSCYLCRPCLSCLPQLGVLCSLSSLTSPRRCIPLRVGMRVRVRTPARCLMLTRLGDSELQSR